MNDAVAPQRKRVDGEVAPPRVGAKIAAERHPRVAPVGLDILAQRRRLDRPAIDDEGHRAMRDAGQRDLEAGRAGAANHLVGRGGRRQIEIIGRLAEREIAHRAADQARLLAFAVEDLERLRQRALSQRRRSLSLAAQIPAGPIIRSVRARARRFRHARARRRRARAAQSRLIATRPRTAAARSDQRQDRNARRRPVFELERIAGAQDEIDRVDRERAQEKSQRLERPPAPSGKQPLVQVAQYSSGRAPDISLLMRHDIKLPASAPAIRAPRAGDWPGPSARRTASRIPRRPREVDRRP